MFSLKAYETNEHLNLLTAKQLNDSPAEKIVVICDLVIVSSVLCIKSIRISSTANKQLNNSTFTMT